MAVISNYNYGTDKEGRLFFKKRIPDVKTKTTYSVGVNDNRIYVDSTNKFPDTGIIQLDVEVIQYNSKDETSFKGCIRGIHGTVPVNHYTGTEVYKIDHVLTNANNYRMLIDCDKRTNYEEIYQAVSVYAGEHKITLDKTVLKEDLYDYALNDELVIQSDLLDNDDIYLAENIAYRYYQTYKEHHLLYDVTIPFCPDISLNETITIYYDEMYRNKIDFVKAKIRKITLSLKDFAMRVTSIGNVKFEKNHEY